MVAHAFHQTGLMIKMKYQPLMSVNMIWKLKKKKKGNSVCPAFSAKANPASIL